MTQAIRQAREAASHKHVRDYNDLLVQAASGTPLNAVERGLPREILDSTPQVVYLQNGHGLEGTALAAVGAKSVVGIDYNAVAGAVQRGANELGLACRYFIGMPISDGPRTISPPAPTL
jgi:hypothetical protein